MFVESATDVCNYIDVRIIDDFVTNLIVKLTSVLKIYPSGQPEKAIAQTFNPMNFKYKLDDFEKLKYHLIMFIHTYANEIRGDRNFSDENMEILENTAIKINSLCKIEQQNL